MTFPRILAALAAAFLGLVPVGAGAQTIGGGGGGSVPLTASCLTQSVAQLCFSSTNTLAQYNGVSAQEYDLYNTRTDASNGEWGGLSWIRAANVLSLFTTANGTGSGRGINVDVNGTVFAFRGNLFATPSGVPVGSGGYFIATAPNTQAGTTYTIATTDSAVILTNAGTVTLTLPSASGSTGRILNLKTTGGGAVVSATSNVVPLVGGAASTAILAVTAGKWAELRSDGTNWVVLAAN